MMSALAFAAVGMSLPAWSGTTGGASGPQVSGHAASATSDGRVLLFGGLTGSAGSPCTNKLWEFSDEGWKELETQGAGPGPRMYSAAACTATSMYVTGGWDPEAPGSGGTFKDEVFRLDLETLTWEAFAPMPCGPVSRHAACTAGDHVLVHTFRGLYVLDEQQGTFREQPTTGEAPGAVSMCAFSTLGSSGHEALLFGGSTKTQEMNADAYVLDTRSWAWRKLRRSGDGSGPSPRASACAAAAGEASCIVFGGAGLGSGGYEGGRGLCASDETWRLRVDGHDAHWELLGSEGDGAKPPARVAASLSALPSNRGLVLQGGWDPKSHETFAKTSVLAL